MQPYDQMIGMKAVDSDGEKIGKIDALYASEESGEPIFATISTGMFGTRTNFFPLSAARLEDDHVVLGITKGDIENAPSIDPDGELGDEEEQKLYDYYEDDADHTDSPGAAESDSQVRDDETPHAEQKPGSRARLRRYIVTETTMRDGVPEKQVRTERVEVDGSDEGNLK